MVGRELLTMCPLGEDHQGDDRGGGTTDNAISTGRGRMMLVWRSLTRMTMLHKVLGSIKIMLEKDLCQTSFVLLV